MTLTVLERKESRRNSTYPLFREGGFDLDVQRFLREENEAIARLSEQVTHAAWMVNTTGEKKWQEAEVEAEKAYRRHFADRKRFEKIAELREKASKVPWNGGSWTACIRRRWKTRCRRNCWMR